MKILITGGAGFIGSHLAESLAKAHEVTVLDGYLKTTYGVKEKENNSENFLQLGIKTIHANLCDGDTYPSLPDFDIAVHLAAMPGLPLSWSDPSVYIENNISATSKLIDHLKSKELSKFIYISTSSVYGKLAIGDEFTDPKPVSPYGVTKLAAEKLLLAHFYEEEVPVSILRIFSVYGPRQRPDMMYSKLFDAAINGRDVEVYGDGTQSRTNTFVDDIIEGIELAIERALPGEIYNIGGGEEVSLNEAISYVEEIVGVKIHRQIRDRRTGDQYRTVANIEKARKELGFSPRVGIHQGLARQFEWLCSQKNKV